MAGEKPGTRRGKGSVRVHLSPDKLTCTLDLFPGKTVKAPLALQEVIETVLQAGVQPSFLREDAIAKALENLKTTGAAQEGVLVALGEPPQAESNWFARPCGEWTDRFVLAGDRLVELVPKTPARPGVALDGTHLPAPPPANAPRLVAGPHTVLSPKGDFLVSETYGTPKLEGLTGSVDPGLQISQDNLTGRIHLVPEHMSGRQISLQDAEQALAAAGIQPECVLVDSLQEAIQELRADPTPVHNLLVAQGRVPESARDGCLEMFTDDPTVGFFPGEEVGRRIPPVEAIDGMDLFGNNLAADNTARDAEMEAGPNTRYDPEEDDRLLSTVYGRAVCSGSRMEVETALRIDPAGQSVSLDVFPNRASGEPVEMASLLSLLEGEKIDPDCLHVETLRLALAEAGQNQAVVADVQVGAAIPSDPGTRGALVLEIPPEVILRPRDLIGRFQGARSPRNGKSIYGDPLPPTEEPAFPVSTGGGVHLERESATITASAYGRLQRKGAFIDVVPCIQVADDGLTATMDLPGRWLDGTLLSVRDVQAHALKRGIPKGNVNLQAVEEALAQQVEPYPVCIATGTPPTPGTAGVPEAPPHLADGCALPGDVLLHLARSAPPTPGQSVLGTRLAPPPLGSEAVLEIEGPGTVEAGRKVVANVYGFANREGSRIVLEEGLRFSEDGLRCTMDLHHRRIDGSQLDVDDVVELLVQSGVQRERIEPEAIAVALRQSLASDTVQPGVLVAMGRPPRVSEDWTICVPDDLQSRCVMVGDTVAWRGARVPSKAGVGVRGEKILAPSSKDRPKLTAGRNCTLDPRGNFITSTVFGRIVADGNRFSVRPALRIDFDKLSARMNVFPRRVGGRALTEEDLVRVLEKAGIESRFVQTLVLRDAVSRAWNEQAVQEEVQVAVAERPVAGQDGKVEALADPKLACVFPGDPVARLLQPVLRQEGVNLLGRPCFALTDGSEAEIQAGEFVSIDGDTARAEVYGQVRINGSVVSIRPGFRSREAGLVLEMNVFPLRGSDPVQLEDLKDLILAQGVAEERVDKKALAKAHSEALERNLPRDRVVVAEALAPHPGASGEVALDGPRKAGCVFTGDNVARLVDAQPPTPGENIFGAPIEAPGDIVLDPMEAGEGVVLQEDGHLARATVFGTPVLAGRRVEVTPGIRISPDGMSCFMDITDRHMDGRELEDRDYLEALAKAGVRLDLVDKELLELSVQAAKNGDVPVEVPIALGIPAQPANPGTPSPIGDLDIGCVLAGDLLGEFSPGTPARSGLSVRGDKIVPSAGDLPAFFQVEGPVALEAGGRRAKAAEYGFARLHDATLALQSGIHIRSDSMRCVMDITHRRTDGSDVTLSHLKKALRQAGIADDRICPDSLKAGLKRARASSETQLRIEAAVGAPPIQGGDWEVRPGGDPRDHCVFVGDTLLERTARTPPKPGLTVRGDRLTAPPNPNRPHLQAGPGSKRSTRGDVILATTYGLASLQGEKASVRPGIRFSADGLACHMDIYPQGFTGREFSSLNLVEAVLATGVLAEFIDENAIEEALATSRETDTPSMDVLVAQGTPIFPGRDGGPEVVTDDPLRCALPGEVFARLSTPDPARPGVSVRGQELPTMAVVKEGLIEAGEFARFSDNEDLALEALAIGTPFCEGSQADIRPATEFAESGRACHLDVHPLRLDGTPLQADDLVGALVKQGVLRERIDTEEIFNTLVRAQKEDSVVPHVLVAMAIDPVPAYPGRLEVVDAPIDSAFFSGEVVARIVDVEPEEVGCGVRGEPLHSDESIEALDVHVGSGCSASVDGLKFTANHYGRLIHDGTFLEDRDYLEALAKAGVRLDLVDKELLELSVQAAKNGDVPELRAGIQIKEDGSTCHLDVLPRRTDGSKMGVTDLMSLLRASGLHEPLVDRDAIRLALETSIHSPQFGVLVATWTPADNGAAGTIEDQTSPDRAFFPGDTMAAVVGARPPAPGVTVRGIPVLPESPIQVLSLRGEGPVLLDETARQATAGAYGLGRLVEGLVVLDPGLHVEAMEVRMDVFSQRASGELIELEDLLGLLASAGVSQERLDESALAEALERAREEGPQPGVCVARGVPPSRESSWQIEVLGVLEDACVLPGDQVVSRRLLDRSEPGCTVLGEPIPPRRNPRPPRLVASDGCSVEENNSVIVASCYGEASFKGQTARVREGVHRSADGLSCTLDIFPRRSSDEAVTESLLRAVLIKAGISEDCMDLEALRDGVQRAWKEQTPQRNVQVARGVRPHAGEHGRVVLATRDSSACALPGDPVARLLPPVDPKEGCDVQGRPIPTEAEVEPGAMEAGEDVLFSPEDQNLLEARLYGQPTVDGPRGFVRRGLRIDAAGLRAEMDFYPRRTTGADVTEDDLVTLLHEAGLHEPLVQWDLVKSSLRQVLETERPIFGVLIAKAKEPHVGFGGHLDPVGGLAGGMVFAGDPVARRVGTIAAVPGIDVTGKALPPPPTPPSVADAVTGCDLHEDGTTFVSSLLGTVRRSGLKMYVEPGLRVSANELACEMDIHPSRPGGRRVSLEDLLGALDEAGIHPDCIDHESLREGLVHATTLDDIHTVVVARGILPQPPRQGEWAVEGIGEGCVLPGMVLASREEETPGREGTGVLGHPIPPSRGSPGTMLRPWGACQLNEAQTEIIATGYGFARKRRHGLEVEPGVRFTNREMRCTVDISPIDFRGKPIGIEHLLLALHAAGIDPAAILSESLQSGLKQAHEAMEIRFGVEAAAGTAPVLSKNWQVEAVGALANHCAFAGDVVAGLGPDQPSKAGRNVLGVRVQAPPNPNRPHLRAGPGCSVTARGRMAVAVLYGEPFLDDVQVGIRSGLRHSEDRLYVTMSIFPRRMDNRAVTEPDLLEVLKAANVPMDRVDLDALRNAIARAQTENAPQRNVRVASGVLPRPPQDGRITTIGDPATTGFLPEQPVARVLPPIPGAPGWTLDDTEVPVEGEGEPVFMEAGEGVHINADEEAQAEWYGNVSVEGATVTVTPGLRFDEAGIECVMDIYPKQGPDTPTELRNLLRVLKMAGVSPDRIDAVTLENCLESALTTGHPQLNVPVALSTAPGPGEPGVLVALGPARQTIAFPGDVVVRLEGAKDPTPGINVMGDELPLSPDAWPEGMTAKDHCLIQEEGAQVEASRYGRVEINQRSVSVVPGVTVSDDRLACFLDVAPWRPNGRPVLLEDLVKVLVSEGIAKDLLDLEALSVALQAASSGLNPNQQRICAARGTLPQEGVPGRIAVADGIEHGCVLPGDVFLQVVDGVAPIPGRNVYGAPISPPPSPVPPVVEAGKGSRLLHGGREVSASVIGRARWDGTTASVDPGLRFVDEDMRCLVEVTRNRFDGSPLQPDQLLAALVQCGVDPSCIDEATLSSKLQAIGEKSLQVWAAHGVPPKEGTHARLESLPALDSGFLRAGDVFLQRIPTEPVVPGRTITGETLVPKKRLQDLEIVETTACTLTQDTLQAETYGGATVELAEIEEHAEGPIQQTQKMRVVIRPGVTVSKDEMSVSMDIYPCHADGTPTSADELLSVLKGLGIDESTVDLHTLDTSIEEAIASGRRQTRVAIANGILPRHGESGWLRLVDLNAPASQVEIVQSGGLLVVNAGDPVLTVEPPARGRHGRTVTGRKLPALPGKPAPLVVGSGIEMRGFTAIARRDGVILSRGGLLDVVPLHVVDSTSQATRVSDGSLDVRISVPESARITAPGDIWVHGDVHCNEITAGGNIVVLGRLLGKEGRVLRVRAGGSVIAEGAEHAEIVSRGDVRLTNGAIQCNIDSDGQIWMDGDPGALVGGKSRAHKGAVIRVLGDADETPTALGIGGEDRASETLRIELERRRLALEMPGGASIDPAELQRICAALEAKLAAALEEELLQPPCFALVWSQAHRGSSVSTQEASMGLGSKSLDAGVFHLSAETGEMVHTLLFEIGVKASLEASVEAVETLLMERRKEAIAKAELESQATEDDPEPNES